jgi:ABC-type glycerol-3-phosphate transport system substrate-binding protein
MCAANDCPDVGFDGHSGGANAVDADRLLPADDFVEAHKDIIDFTTLGAKYNDHYYSGFKEELDAYVVVYSKPLLAEIGLDEFPKTWDDLLAAGEAVKAAGKALTSLSNWTNYILYLYIQQSTDTGLQAFLDGNWDSPTWLESMKHVEQLLPYLDENDLEHDAGTIPLSVSEGTMLFDINGPWIMGNLNMDIEAVPNAIGGAPMPTPGGPLMVGGSGYAISMTAFNTGHPERVEAVWTFFDYWITDEEIVQGFITDAKSPMGVHTEWITEERCGPALWTFMGPMFNEGDKGYQRIGPWTKTNAEAGVTAACDAMRLGEDAEDALQEFLAVIESG